MTDLPGQGISGECCLLLVPLKISVFQNVTLHPSISSVPTTPYGVCFLTTVLLHSNPVSASLILVINTVKPAHTYSTHHYALSLPVLFLLVSFSLMAEVRPQLTPTESTTAGGRQLVVELAMHVICICTRA